jgi:hypothetical protein
MAILCIPSKSRTDAYTGLHVVHAPLLVATQSSHVGRIAFALKAQLQCKHAGSAA